MEYRRARTTSSIVIWVVVALIYVISSLFISRDLDLLGTMFSSAILFLVLFYVQRKVFSSIDINLQHKRLKKGITRYIVDFTETVRTCFTNQEFVVAIRTKLENKLDASALLIQSSNWEIIYQSTATLTANPSFIPKLKRNFDKISEGFAYVSENFELQPRRRQARGFLIFSKGYYFFVFSRVTTFVEEDAYRMLLSEMSLFFDRLITVAKLFDIAALTKEWRQIADTQRTFLPEILPEQNKLSIGAYWRPLVNVSGDFYDVITIDEHRTLLVLGDVSGKGLGAALVMGIAINTIRAVKDKTDLVGILRTVDNAIKTMGFDDKYTVMFLGLIDTETKRFRYVNAALPEQFMIVQTVKGSVVKRLESNCGIIGLVPLDSVEVEDIELRTNDIIVLTTDGLTEITNSEGVSIDQSPDFNKLMTSAIDLTTDDLVERLATLGETYISDKTLRDDITILAAKVGRLWD